MKTILLPIDKIYLKDERFRISYHFPQDELLFSLKKIGLINPPIVTLRSNRFILVSGWKRVLACLKLSISSIPVFVLEEEDDLKAFKTTFYDNLATREFSLLEKSEILKRLKKFGEKDKEIVKQYLPLLGIPATLVHFDTYLIFSQFRPELKNIIHKKKMPYSSLEMLAEFNPHERELVLPLILPLGQNKQKEILEDLQFVSKKSDIPIEKILGSEEIQDILVSERLSHVQKADKVRRLLKRKRYPLFFALKESFDSSLKKMQLPKEIKVSPSPFFEDEEFSVTFSFKNKEEFRKRLLKLQELNTKEEFFELFKDILE